MRFMAIRERSFDEIIISSKLRSRIAMKRILAADDEQIIYFK